MRWVLVYIAVVCLPCLCFSGAIHYERRASATADTVATDTIDTLALRLQADSLARVQVNDSIAEVLIDRAKGFIGCHYRPGGTGPHSFDCSGFTSFIYRMYGKELTHSSRAQYGEGEHVETQDLKPGDLVFFAGRRGGKNINHVGIVTEVLPDGRFRFIHATFKKGITIDLSSDDYYARRYVGACRVLS